MRVCVCVCVSVCVLVMVVMVDDGFGGYGGCGGRYVVMVFMCRCFEWCLWWKVVVTTELCERFFDSPFAGVCVCGCVGGWVLDCEKDFPPPS